MSDFTEAESGRLLELDALLEDVAAMAQDSRPPTIAEESLTFAQELALGLFVATFEVFLGIRAVLRERLVEEARMLSRTLLEDTARLVWLVAVRDDPAELETRALRFVFDSLQYERHLMRIAQRNGQEWAEEELTRLKEERKSMKADAAERGMKLDDMPRPSELLRSIGQEDLYQWHVRASQSIHSSRIGISARFHPGEGATASVEIRLQGSLVEVVRVGGMAMQTFSIAMIAAADLLGWSARDRLVAYREKVLRLSDELLERVRGDEPE